MAHKMHYYTISVDGNSWQIGAPYYEWEKVEKALGVPRKYLTRGANDTTPFADFYTLLDIQEQTKDA